MEVKRTVRESAIFTESLTLTESTTSFSGCKASVLSVAAAVFSPFLHADKAIREETARTAIVFLIILIFDSNAKTIQKMNGFANFLFNMKF
ncbi:hypothetical protein [Chryseobacterium carnipullorum]|uniref:hypothetical protein n=1 Tax=Chryseobacterium carnipullorum TaxID=1124835 RepID=UPI001E4E852D|nr:hypothetical protein [Chryseobacterium carnipullorum]